MPQLTLPWGHLDNNAERPTPEQRKHLVDTLEAPPVRCARNGGGNVTGLFPSRKNGRSVEFESGGIERMIIFLLEASPQVLGFKEQPATLEVLRVNKAGVTKPERYIPDFLAEVASGLFVYIEGKPSANVERLVEKGSTRYVKGDDGRWRDPAAEKVCRALGAEHIIVTDKDLNPVLLRNLHFLFEYISSCPPDESLAKETRKMIGRRSERYATLAELNLCENELAQVYSLIGVGNIPSAVNFRSIHEPQYFLLFADEKAQLLWELNQAPPRALQLNVFQVVAGSKFRLRNRDYTCKQIDGDAAVVVSAHGSATFSVEHLRGEWEAGHLVVKVPEVAPSAIEGFGRAELQEALRRFDILKGAKTDAADRTVREWRRRLQHAQASGQSPVDALAPRTSKRGCRRARIDVETARELDEFLIEEFFVAHHPKALFCYRRYRTATREQGKIPVGRSTFYMRIKALRPKHNWKRVGKKKHYREQGSLAEPDGVPPLNPEGEFAFAVGHIDHTPIDTLTKHPKTGKVTKRRIWLTIMLDAYSRRVLAWFFSFRDPSRVSCMMVLRDCIRRHGRLPRTLVVDNGSEFQSHFFRRVVIALGSELVYRPPHMPRHGAVSERLFRTLNDGLFHNLRGNTQHLKEPRAMGKDVDPRRLAIETFASLYEKFEHWVMNVYHQRPHQGLGVTPDEVFRGSCAKTGILNQNTVIVDEQFLGETAIEVEDITRKLHRHGVVVDNIRYNSPALKEPKYVGSAVEVRWDPEDIRIVHVLLGDRWVTARSTHSISFQHCQRERLRIISEVYRDRILGSARYIDSDVPDVMDANPEAASGQLDQDNLREEELPDDDWTRFLSDDDTGNS